jgi:hypothetical protein
MDEMQEIMEDFLIEAFEMIEQLDQDLVELDDEMDFVFEKITGQKSNFKEKFGGGTDEKVESKKEKVTPKKESKKDNKKVETNAKVEDEISVSDDDDDL